MALFTKTEWHQVASVFTYDIPDEDLIESFGSVERFYEVLSQMDQQAFSDIEPMGEEATEEEMDAVWEITHNYDYDREDDWWTDRKGGYDITFDFDQE